MTLVFLFLVQFLLFAHLSFLSLFTHISFGETTWCIARRTTIPHLHHAPPPPLILLLLCSASSNTAGPSGRKLTLPFSWNTSRGFVSRFRLPDF